MSAAETHEAPRGGSGAMFDAIAERYDLLNRVMSFGTDRGWRKKTVAALELEARAAEHPERAPRVLDLATGTADLALDVLARHPGVEVIGVDPSKEMMKVGARKAEAAGVAHRISFIEGDAQALPLPDGSCDAICMAFGIRNVPDRALALREMRRVAGSGARVAILELGEPRNGALAPFARLHIRHVVPRLGALISGASEYRYLQESVARFPAPEEFAATIAAAGLEVVAVRPLTFGVCTLYVARAPRGGGGEG